MYRITAVILFIITSYFSSSGQTIPVKESDAFNVPVRDYKGLEPYLHTSSDTLYVVNFWATWCIPCVKELPNFLKLDSVYGSKKVKVILVSLDVKSHLTDQLVPFLKKRNIKTKVLLLSDMDMDNAITKIDPKWDGTIPCTIIYNKARRKFYPQEFTYPELETEIKNFINN